MSGRFGDEWLVCTYDSWYDATSDRHLVIYCIRGGQKATHDSISSRLKSPAYYLFQISESQTISTLYI